MQSNSAFIPSFAQKAAPLRELTKENVRFQWSDIHEDTFRRLLSEFKEDVLLRYFDLSKPIYITTDAHITGMGATLSQGDTLESSKPVAFASRTTTDAERKYPQLDLEGLGVDFGLRRFRNYIIGAPHPITVVTDHMPLCSVFNGSRTGSIRTERYKQSHQDIQYKVVYIKGKSNQADFLSRRGIPIQELEPEEKMESDEVNNLLYMLHTTPIVDRISLKDISDETTSDPTLSMLRSLVNKGQTWISKTANPDLQKFRPVLPEITVTGNGILLKGDRIILPEKLQKLAIELAHRGSHPGQSAMERRLRYHFYFSDMKAKVATYLDSCIDCKMFTEKKTHEPQKCHDVPERCWDKVSVDLFGPMPSKHHIVVVQDIASRYPEAKLVTSTAAKKVVPVLESIYDTYGNPIEQLSDNGPPFNSAAMTAFAGKRGIKLEKTPPYHPSANPVESFMRPLGKAMKIAHHSSIPEKEALNTLLGNYRDTPHPATGLPPSAMIFRDAVNTSFPRQPVSDDAIKLARERDVLQKQQYESKVNESKFKRNADLRVGDAVIIRNYRKQRKFEPTFLPEKFTVISISDFGRCLHLKRYNDGALFYRHPDDVKQVSSDYNQNGPTQDPMHIDTGFEDMWYQIRPGDYEDPVFGGYHQPFHPGDHQHQVEDLGWKAVAPPLDQDLEKHIS